MGILDNFSEKEIRQIKEELEKRREPQKNEYISRPVKQLRAMWRMDSHFSTSEEISNYSDVEGAIRTIVDNTLHNFKYKQRHSDNGKYVWIVPSRDSLIARRVSPFEYAEMYQELVDVIEKHFKPVLKAEAEKIGREEGTIK